VVAPAYGPVSGPDMVGLDCARRSVRRRKRWGRRKREKTADRRRWNHNRHCGKQRHNQDHSYAAEQPQPYIPSQSHLSHP